MGRGSLKMFKGLGYRKSMGHGTREHGIRECGARGRDTRGYTVPRPINVL